MDCKEPSLEQEILKTLRERGRFNTPEEVEEYFKESLKRVREDEKKRIQGFLLENGHGGGNWRRIILQL